MKSQIIIKDDKKEYPNMTLEQITKMVEYLNQGMSEEEAKAKALEEVK